MHDYTVTYKTHTGTTETAQVRAADAQQAANALRSHWRLYEGTTPEVIKVAKRIIRVRHVTCTDWQ